VVLVLFNIIKCIMERSIFSKSNLSSRKLLNSSELISKIQPGAGNLSQTIELSNIFVKSDHGGDEQDSNVISEVEPNDFGYYYMDREGMVSEINAEDIVLDQSVRFKDINLISSYNYKSYNDQTKRAERVFKNMEDILTTLVYGTEGSIAIPEVRSLKLSGGLLTEYNDIQYTYNSYILNGGAEGNQEHAVNLNKEYKKRKDRIEIDILFKLMKKYEILNRLGLRGNEPLAILKNETSLLRSEIKDNTEPDRETLRNWRSKINAYLKNLVRNIGKHINEDTVNCIKWKNKLNEMVNIWDLFLTNGIELKFSPKYIVLKKYFTLRAKSRQEKVELVTEKEKENIISNIFTSIIRQDAKKPKSIILPNDFLNIALHSVIWVLLLYNLFTIPLIQFIGYNNSTINYIDKFIDGVFFIEIVLNFRTVYKDRHNNYVYNIHKIFNNYVFGCFVLDIITTIPWHFFFVISRYYNRIKALTSCIRVLRICKLWPIFNKIDAMRFTYLRILRLVFVYFFAAHWMGCIIYYVINESLDYSGLVDYCYEHSSGRGKENLTIICTYIIPVYTAGYIIPGEYISLFRAHSSLCEIYEYITLVFMYIIGQVLAAYLFGGMTSIIQNLNQGENFFTNKIDLLNEHMRFYDISQDTMDEVKLYFDYLWQRHKDVIYGKDHFELLNKSLRERFERLNLLGNELLLAQFYNLNPTNPKLIGIILKNLTKVILFPNEILFEELSVTKGVYIILNGDIELSNKDRNFNIASQQHSIKYADIIKATEDSDYRKKLPLYKEKFSIVFPLISAFIKTGRTLNRCFSRNFTDLLFLPLEIFEQLLTNFPIEMHILKQNIMTYVESQQLFDNKELFKSLSQHSSRSVSNYFSDSYNKVNIWIPIPLPISQRKIALNYGESFVNKVRNLWKEIITSGDLNLCLASFDICKLFMKKDDDYKINPQIHSEDTIESVKALSKIINNLSERIIAERK
jgi:hypothetical protein